MQKVCAKRSLQVKQSNHHGSSGSFKKDSLRPFRNGTTRLPQTYLGMRDIQWATPSAAGPLNAATFNWLFVLRLLRVLDFAEKVEMVETIEIDAANFDFLQ